MSHLNLARSLRFLALIVTPVVATAQNFTAKRIVFQNPDGFTQAQLETVSGLHAGMTLKAADLTTAAQKLMDSGYFEDITPSVDGLLNAASIILALKPLNAAQLLPVGFENFVWLTPDDLHAAAVKGNPLFHETLPEASSQLDAIGDALKAALAAKGVKAEVEHEIVQPTLEHPARVVEFRVLQPPVVVANVHLTGVASSLVPLVQKSVNSTARTPLNLGLAGERTNERILAPLLDAGYLHASLANESVAPPTGSAESVPVIVTAALQPGEIYHVSQLAFAGTPLLPAEAFAKTQTLHSGDVASRSTLLKTLAPLDSAYRAQGYMDVRVNTEPTFDESAHTIRYTVSVIPGEQYHVHDVTVEGLDGAPRADFDRNFQMKPGVLYNPVYIADFLRNNTALRSLSNVSGAFKAVAYPATHTVDLTVRFFHLASR